MRTREGMKVAEAKGRLRGKQPQLTAKQESHLLELHAAGDHSKASWLSCLASAVPLSTVPLNTDNEGQPNQYVPEKSYAEEYWAEGRTLSDAEAVSLIP